MRWTIENEELPLSLYFEVKTRREKKRKKDVERCKWIAGKLRDEAKLDYSTTLVAKFKKTSVSVLLNTGHKRAKCVIACSLSLIALKQGCVEQKR